jgi:hypothetical protein
MPLNQKTKLEGTFEEFHLMLSLLIPSPVRFWPLPNIPSDQVGKPFTTAKKGFSCFVFVLHLYQSFDTNVWKKMPDFLLFLGMFEVERKEVKTELGVEEPRSKGR